MSRAEIDALVAQQLRGEDAVAVRPTRRRAPRRRGRWTAVLVVAVLCLVGWTHRPRAAEAVGLYSESGLPAHPARYADGSYQFWQVQPTNPSQPVGYNPCKNIDVEINYFDATPTIQDDVQRVITMVNRVSGLHLRYVGASMRRRLSQVDGRILVSFAGARTDPVMTADIAGWGGSAYPAYYPDQMLYFAGGSVTLNTDTYPRETHDEQLLILAHEFGHAVGLAHAPGAELMNANPWPYGLHHYAHGDLTGLAKLGQLPCH